MAKTVVAVDAPHFCAALVLEDDRCVHAAPILRWAIGKDRATLSAYFKRKGWKAVVANPSGTSVTRRLTRQLHGPLPGTPKTHRGQDLPDDGA